MFGSDGVSEELKGGTADNNLNALVTVNGVVETGINKNQSLVIPKTVNLNDGTGAVSTGGITFRRHHRIAGDQPGQ